MDDELRGQRVVVLGGSAGIGLETARLARARGADVILVARDPDRLRDAARQLDASSTAAFDVTDLARARTILRGGAVAARPHPGHRRGPYYSPLADIDFDRARRESTTASW